MKEVTITFLLTEDVTPDLFAQKVAAACFGYYALREDERLRVDATGTVFKTKPQTWPEAVPA